MLDYTNSATIYLSQSNGNDCYSGFSDVPDGYGAGPVATFERVMDLLRNMRACGVLQPITVKIMGDYYLESSVKLGFSFANPFFAKDLSMNNITFTSYDVGSSRIIGGRRATGFVRDTFRGISCVSLSLPEVKAGTLHFSDLYIGKKRATPAIYPKEGTLRAVTTENPAPESFLIGSKWFIAHKEDLAAIEGIEHATVSYYHYWIDEHSPVESYDRESGKLTMRYSSRFQISADYERDSTAEFYYRLENIPEGFTDPGDWYLDVKEGMLYYIPTDEDPAPELLEAYLPTLENLVTVGGTKGNKIRGIRFQNLEFFCSRGDYVSRDMVDGEEKCYAADIQSLCNAPGAVRFLYAEDCEVSNCRFSNLGLHAVEIFKGCTNVRVENNRMEDLGGGGIKLMGGTHGEDPANTSTSCSLCGNTIRRIGLSHAAACGILVIHSAHNDISENTISDTRYSGISVGWVWGYYPSVTRGNRIKNNHISRIGMGDLSDMGGIYLLGPQDGTVVEGNTVHDINSAHYGGFGIYTDEGASFITVESNLVYRCKTACYHQHYGSYNTLRHNIFAFGDERLIHLSRSDAHTGLLVEDNTLITMDGIPIYACFDDRFKGNILALSSSRNRIWDPTGDPVLVRYEDGGKTHQITLSDYQTHMGKETESTVEEPTELLIDPTAKIVKRNT